MVCYTGQCQVKITGRSLRKGKKISQEDLAKICGLHRTYISQIEIGRRNIALKNIVKIAKALGVAPKDLL